MYYLSSSFCLCRQLLFSVVDKQSFIFSPPPLNHHCLASAQSMQGGCCELYWGDNLYPGKMGRPDSFMSVRTLVDLPHPVGLVAVSCVLKVEVRDSVGSSCLMCQLTLLDSARVKYVQEQSCGMSIETFFFVL